MTAEPPPDAATRPSWRRRLPAIVGTVITVVCLALVARVLASEWSQVSDRLAHARVAPLVGAAVFGILGMFLIAWVWADVLAALGARRARRVVVAWYFVGEMGKYLPGAIWAAVGRGELARRDGIPTSQAYPSVVLSLAGLYLAAALVATALVPFDLAHRADAGAALLILLLVPIGLGALHPRILGWAVDRLRRVTGRTLDLEIPSWGTTVGLVLRYVPTWVCIGVSTWLVARALLPDANPTRVVLATVLSWTAGFLTPTPSGAGVREGVFVATAGLPGGEGAAVAIASRIIFVLVDVGGAAVGAPILRGRRTQAPPVTSAGPEPYPARQEES